MKLKENIKECIDARREAGELTPCVFGITTPKVIGTKNSQAMKKVQEILKRNGIKAGWVDTMPGSYNLDRDWLEMESPTPCAVEYCGAYPADWNIDDVVELDRMESKGEIIIHVSQVADGEYIPNH